jgi:hypothetical protein
VTLEDTMDLNPYLYEVLARDQILEAREIARRARAVDRRPARSNRGTLAGRLVAWLRGPAGSNLSQPRLSGETRR